MNRFEKIADKKVLEENSLNKQQSESVSFTLCFASVLRKEFYCQRISNVVLTNAKHCTPLKF